MRFESVAPLNPVRTLTVAVLAAATTLALAPAAPGAAFDESKLPPAASRPVDFLTDIQPIFEDACIKCHGPEKQKSGFRLDRRADALAGGDNYAPAIVPGKGAESPLLHSVSGLDEDFVMPQKGEALTAGQVGLIRAWIDQGAVWPDDGSVASEDPLPWSFLPLEVPAVPDIVETVLPVRTPVDRFIFAGLAKKGLAPSPEVDARTLIRRASLTLIGMPPTPEETEAFIRDTDPQAYEKLVDRLLASPQFGERWAQHWLDVVRFAETNGSESNLYRKNAWPYRDYVIRAFNQDLPFDRFIREQIAGDAQGVDEATTFLVSGMFVTADTVGREEAAIRQARSDRLDETIQTVSASMLGVTMSCARCHNHKFDPIPQKDYYSLAAVFAGVEYGSRPWRSRPGGAARAQRAAELQRQIAAVRDQLRSAGATWTEEWPTHLQTHFAPVTTRVVRIRFPEEFGGAVDEVEIFGPATGDRNLALASHGTVARSHKKTEDLTRPVSNLIDGVADKYHDWRTRNKGEKAVAAWFEIELPEDAVLDHLAISTDRDTIATTDYLLGPTSRGPDRYRVEVRTTAGEWREIANVDVRPAARKIAPHHGLLQRLKELTSAYTASLPQPLFAGQFIAPEKTFVFDRGDPMNSRDEVVPGALTALGSDLGLTSESSGLVRRLAFAEWLTGPQRNPLTPRVLANRFWLHVFGHGLVDTPGDFGRAGAVPSNPALLDWLAAEFLAQGWSPKKLIRLLATSSVFRQSSAPNPAAARIDAQAQLLWRFPPRRVEAEVLRDSTLVVAGTLDATMGGPGFRIHGDKKRFEGWQVIDNAGPSTWRRMIYQERMRGIDDLMFTAFDRPECGQVTPKRTISTTPLQALNLFNGEFILTQAEKLAERVIREEGTNRPAQVRRVFELVLGRAPERAEARSAAALVAHDGLPALCRALFNTNEFAFIE
jgi:cytochrome c553